MAIREIPKAYDYICDVCGFTHRQENAGGHYANSRPEHWGELVVKQDAYDFQGAAVADGTIKRLLCSDCREGAIKAINDWAAFKIDTLKKVADGK